MKKRLGAKKGIAKTVSLPAEVMEALRREAHQKGWNVSTLLIDLLRSALRPCES